MAASKLGADASLRRRGSRWLAAHAWKLAGLTAAVAFCGVLVSVLLSLVLRPTRSYFFPLLSDVDKHQPEGAILRIAFVVATCLLVATTSASVLHCQSIRALSLPGHAHADADADADALESDAESDGAAAALRRRVARFSNHQLAILVPLTLISVASFMQYTGMAAVLGSSLRRGHITLLGVWFLSAVWAAAMVFLMWYFIKLQTMPDNVLPATVAEVDVELDEMVAADDTASFTAPHAPLFDRLRSWAAWLIVVLRPICLTGQVVCVIKIVGLWFALETFSISNIRLIKITLLAALAFAEYTAAFFFAFFMTILAVDIRAKQSVTLGVSDPELLMI